MPSDRSSTAQLAQLCADVLIVDDDPRNHLAVEAMLEDLDLRLVFASSGEEALAQLLRRDFAAIVLDVRMPGMDGFETAELLRSRERTRHVPIIFVTAYGDDEANMRRGYRLGAVDYLFKPIVAEALRAKLQVFADLYRRTEEVKRQADWIREVDRRDTLRRLEHERRKWEAAALRRRMREQTRLNEQLAEEDKRKDEFIALLAHELRNPLAPLVTSLELIRRRLGDDPVVARARDAMQRQVHRMTRLVDDLLDTSRISRGKVELKKEHLDLGQVVAQAVELCQPTLDKMQHRLTLAEPDRPIPIHADDVRMTQVLSNLLQNAAQYSDAGSEITIGWGEDEGRAFACVSDQGRGIAADMLDRIFDSFVQAQDGGRGLGLGLTLVKRLVEMHGGAVEARSDGPGMGSELMVRLPLAEERAQPKPPPSPTPSSVPHPTLSVVVVEDDDDVRVGLRDLLESWGHTVAVANNGLRGVDLLLEVRPDIGLLDIGLPGLDGYSVAQRIRDAMGHLAPRLVALSGFGQDNDHLRSLRAGFDVHLVKPPDLDELERVLAQSTPRETAARRTTPRNEAVENDASSRG